MHHDMTEDFLRMLVALDVPVGENEKHGMLNKIDCLNGKNVSKHRNLAIISMRFFFTWINHGAVVFLASLRQFGQ